MIRYRISVLTLIGNRPYSSRNDMANLKILKTLTDKKKFNLSEVSCVSDVITKNLSNPTCFQFHIYHTTHSMPVTDFPQ